MGFLPVHHALKSGSGRPEAEEPWADHLAVDGGMHLASLRAPRISQNLRPCRWPPYLKPEALSFTLYSRLVRGTATLFDPTVSPHRILGCLSNPRKITGTGGRNSRHFNLPKTPLHNHRPKQSTATRGARGDIRSSLGTEAPLPGCKESYFVQDFVSVAHVCRFWRPAAINTPDWWTKISMRNMEVIKMFLETSWGAFSKRRSTPGIRRCSRNQQRHP